MAISIATKRRKLSVYNDTPTTITVGTPVESDDSDKLFFPAIAATPINPPSFSVSSCTTVTGNTLVTTSTANGFAQVQAGDVVTGTGIPADTIVIEKINPTNITISDPATASGTVALSFDPDPITPTYYAIEISHAPSATGEELIISSVTLHKYDGSLGGATATPNNSTSKVSLVPVPNSPRGAMNINVDEFLDNLRVPPSA